ncbi:hypothetical protein CTAYLR_000865 [Chrysophaeum taylorii]|uniref:Uncharacterized protein n=1 Tax=Chrysophaeum taylorii TaxID=2483200 RepID=A0AAD7XSA3_9STRA|nr:hypothetical protein CTAYLR_000865 [Chrysophaeum taylorii]
MLSEFGQLEVHPLHGLSNRILAIVSVMLLGLELDSRVLVDWRLDDSKFINAPISSLLDVRRFAGGMQIAHRPSRRAASFTPNRCDAYYRQLLAGWHERLESPAPYSPDAAGLVLRAYSNGGGFAGKRPGLALDEYVRGSLPACNETDLIQSVAGGKRRPNLPDVAREGCSAFFRGFEGLRSCSRAASSSPRRALKMGLSLWSPITPLNGTCVFALLPPSQHVLNRVRWLPRKTLGIHVRHGDFDPRWPRASLAEWFSAVDETLKLNTLHHIFVASDDRHVYEAFADNYARRPKMLLPRYLADEYMPRGNKRVDRLRLWSKEGNIASLAEQLTLASADVILGSWGSTYSTLAAAWFDRPLVYVPRSHAADCDRATALRPCRWRGAATYPSNDHVYGAKCGVLVDYVERLRVKQHAGWDDELFEHAVALSRYAHGYRDNVTSRQLGRKSRRMKRFMRRERDRRQEKDTPPKSHRPAGGRHSLGR